MRLILDFALELTFESNSLLNPSETFHYCIWQSLQVFHFLMFLLIHFCEFTLFLCFKLGSGVISEIGQLVAQNVDLEIKQRRERAAYPELALAKVRLVDSVRSHLALVRGISIA